MKVQLIMEKAQKEKERRDSDIRTQISELAYLSVVQMCESESIFMEPSNEKKAVNKIFSKCKTLSDKMIRVRESIEQLNIDYVGNFIVNEILNSGICLLNIVNEVETYNDLSVVCAIESAHFEFPEVPPYV